LLLTSGENMKTARSAFAAIGSVMALIGCAAPSQHANAPDARTTENESESREAPPRSTTILSAAIHESETDAIPTTCSGEQAIKDTKACVPPGTFVKKLCGGIYPEVALAMFAKGTPWTRIWLSGDVEAWNASGGLTHRAKLAFDEEVLVLSRHGAGNSGGIMMTGAMASFDVLRWDGTCVSVLEGELTTRRPPAPKPASVPWSHLEETTRRALLTSPKVKTTLEAFEKACGTGDKTACEKADKAFARSVADFVRSGSAALPAPVRRP
jgi:hypothetical protein